MKPTRIEPGPDQESVWDYPRPPIMERTPEIIRVVFNGIEIACSTRTLRFLETSHPPTYYIPPQDIRMEFLRPSAQKTHCEWKGAAHYYDVVTEGREVAGAAWAYANPVQRYAELKDHVAFYAQHMDACFVGDERVQAQAGDFYGGWVTSKVVGPFKGAAGTWGW